MSASAGLAVDPAVDPATGPLGDPTAGPTSDPAGGAPTIAVVGGGILGCLIAREISARSPEATVLLVERDAVGSGASRRSAGLSIPSGRTERIRQMAAFSGDYYARLAQSRPELPIYPVAMTVSAHKSGAGEQNVEGCHYADVDALVRALIRDLRPRVRVREGVQVTGIESDSGGVDLDLGTGERLRADHAVLAPGPWIHAPAWRHHVEPLGLRVKKVAALHAEQRPAEGDRVRYFADDDAFLLPLAHRGHWLFSFTCQEWDVDPDALHEGLSRSVLHEARTLLRRHAPALAEHAMSGRVFCDAYSPDREPRVQALDAAGRIVFAGAACGSGYRLAPAIAAQAVGLLPLLPVPSQPWSQS
jgi:glycine/D-amino acid oxidase-like deaminating enzyme